MGEVIGLGIIVGLVILFLFWNIFFIVEQQTSTVVE